MAVEHVTPLGRVALAVACLLVGAVAIVVAVLQAERAPSSAAPPSSVERRPAVAKPVLAACANPPCVNVGNACPFPVWMEEEEEAAGRPSTERTKLDPGQAVQLPWPTGANARLRAFYQDPTAAAAPQAFEPLHLSVAANGRLRFGLSYVDGVAVPSSLTAGPGAQCAADQPSVACLVPFDDLRATCPRGDGFDLWDAPNERCVSAGAFCRDAANADAPVCHRLDGTLAQWAGGAGHTTADVYAGDVQGPEGPRWCAALNRNMLSAPDATDASLFYQGTAYNPYAAWVHRVCPGLYAMAHDAYPAGAEPNGQRECATDRLDVLWCPAEAP